MSKRNIFPKILVRKKIEKLGATDQCKAIIGSWQKSCDKGVCYLCGIPLCERYGRLSYQSLSYPSDPRNNKNVAPPPQCDHLLPVKEMATFLCGGSVTKDQILQIQKNYAAISTVKYLSKLKVKTVFTVLKFLDWTHAPCNQIKSDMRFIQVYENKRKQNVSDSYAEIYEEVFDRNTSLKDKAAKYDKLLKTKGFIKIHDFQWAKYSSSVPPKDWIWLPNLTTIYKYLFRLWYGLNSDSKANQGQNGGFAYYLRTKFVPQQFNKILRGSSILRGHALAQYYNSRFNQLQARQRWWFEMRSRILIETFYKVCYYLNVPGDKQFKWRKIWREINNIPCGFRSSTGRSGGTKRRRK